MNSKFVPDAADEAINETRATMGKRIGEVIEGVIGDKRIRELFDKAGGHPEEHAGKPTGIIALDMGVISPDTKTALLVAQAAERATQLADKAAKISDDGKGLVASKTQLDRDNAGYVSSDDPIFKFVGSPRDPAILQRAQATWMMSQIYLNNEISAVNGQISSPYAVDTAYTLGTKHADGIRRDAAELYKTAAGMLRAEGHTAAADKLDKVSGALGSAVKDNAAPGAAAAANELKWRDQKAGQDLMIVLNNDSYLEPTRHQDTLGKLAALISPKQAPADTPAAKAPAGKKKPGNKMGPR